MNSKAYNNTELNRMIGYLADRCDKGTDEYRLLNEFIELQEKRFAEENDGRPFISIITRTQGKRPEMLSEALLCVGAQSDTDFELLVVGHNVSKQDTETVKTIISDLPDWMREKTRYIPVEGGGRATPLNRGFEEARGKYITIFDDDDLVFDNWIEEFRKCADENPGKIIHCYAISQGWETLGGDYPDTPAAVEKPMNTFCKDYDFNKQLVFNICPTMTLAFPAYAFKVFNIRFDEELSTTEDWDFLMRTAFLTGVYNHDVPTSIYRQWKNAENSRSVHDQREWKKNYENILRKYIDIPAFFDKTSMASMVKTVLYNKSIADSELFYSKNKAFSQKNTLLATYDENGEFPYMFDLEGKGPISSIRIDPCDIGDIQLKNIWIKVVFEDGEERLFSIDDVKSNGYKEEGSIYFLKGDPQTVIELGAPKNIKKVYYDAEIIYPMPSFMVDKILGRETSYRAFFKKTVLSAKRLGRLLKK